MARAAASLQKGIELFNRGHYSKAAAALAACARGDPGSDAQYLLARALAAAGRSQSAERALNLFLEERPEHEEGRELKVELLLAGAFRLKDMGRFDEALERCDRVLRLSPSRSEAVQLRDVLMDAREAGGDPVRVLYRRLVASRRFAEAFEVGERLLDRGPSAATIRLLTYPWDAATFDSRRAANLRALRGLNGPWAAHYRAVLAGDPTMMTEVGGRHAWMLQNVGRLWLDRRDFRRAAACFRRALAHPPADPLNHGFLAEALACLGRPAEAFAELRRGRKSAASAHQGELLAWEAGLALWLGRYRLAARAAERGKRLGGRWAYCWSAGAQLLLGRPGRALRDAEEALRIHPADAEAKVWLAETLRALGRRREALRALRAVPASNRWAAVNRALCRRDLQGAARAALERSLRLARGNRREPSYLDVLWEEAGPSGRPRRKDKIDMPSA